MLPRLIGSQLNDEPESRWMFRRGPTEDYEEIHTKSTEIFLPFKCNKTTYAEERCNGISFAECYRKQYGHYLSDAAIKHVNESVLAQFGFGNKNLYCSYEHLHVGKFISVQLCMHRQPPEQRERFEKIAQQVLDSLNRKMREEWIRHRVPTLRRIIRARLRQDDEFAVKSIMHYSSVPQDKIGSVVHALKTLSLRIVHAKKTTL